MQAPSRVDSVTAETASATLDLGGTKTGTITFHIHGQNLDSLQGSVKIYAADGSVVSLGQPVRTGNGTDDTYSVTATAAAAGSTSVILQITGRRRHDALRRLHRHRQGEQDHPGPDPRRERITQTVTRPAGRFALPAVF